MGARFRRCHDQSEPLRARVASFEDFEGHLVKICKLVDGPVSERSSPRIAMA